jgi:RNA polymerase sigma-70 factor, ECF subfamily
MGGIESEMPSVRLRRVAAENLRAAWRVAKRCGVARGELDDVVQEVFIVVCRRLGDIPRDRERAFVVGTTVRVAANFRRSERRRPALSVSGAELETFPAGAFSPEAQAARSEGLEVLDRALNRMTQPQRAVFILCELEQLTAAEAAEQLSLEAAAVVSRLRRAREVFREFCEQWQSSTPSASPSDPIHEEAFSHV